jgi:hypothetical protein
VTHRTIPSPLRPDEALRRQFAQADGLPFADLLSAEQLRRVLDDCQVDFRERIFSPLVTIATFLTQVLDPDHSMRQAVARLIAYRTSLQLPACSADTRAYSKARQRLPENVFAELARRTGRDLMLEAPVRWFWRGHVVKMVDGTTVSMPDTPANQKAYPQSTNQKPGLGFPILRLVALFSLSVGSVLDIAMGPHRGKRTGETALFRSLHHHLDEGDVLLADRYFCGYFQIALVRRRGAHIVMRLHQRRHYDFRCGRRLGPDDHVVTWHKPEECPDWLDESTFACMPETITMRELRIRVPGKTGRTRTIVVATTLLDPQAYPKESLAELYRQRWHAELDLRSLKTFLQMDILRCQSPAMVRKEIWVHVLGYNLIRKVIAQAAQEHGMMPRQISFKGALQTLNAFCECLRLCAPCALADVCHRLLTAIVQHGVGERPDRLEPRARKRRPKFYPLLNQTRAKARKTEMSGT